jgi:hypothetical protein
LVDEIPGFPFDFLTGLGPVLLRNNVSHTPALTARLIGSFHDHFINMVEHIFPGIPVT